MWNDPLSGREVWQYVPRSPEMIHEMAQDVEVWIRMSEDAKEPTVVWSHAEGRQIEAVRLYQYPEDQMKRVEKFRQLKSLDDFRIATAKLEALGWALGQEFGWPLYPKPGRPDRVMTSGPKSANDAT